MRTGRITAALALALPLSAVAAAPTSAELPDAKGDVRSGGLANPGSGVEAAPASKQGRPARLSRAPPAAGSGAAGEP